MIVGIDARAAAEVPAGGGRVVRELLKALHALGGQHEYRLYCRQPWLEEPLGERLRWVQLKLPDPAWHAAAAAHASRGCDVFLSTNSYLTPWMLTVPSVVLVYDLIPFLPEVHSQKRARRIERATIAPAIRRATRLVCISRSTERDLLTRFPRAAAKTAVVPLAAADLFHERRDPATIRALTERHGVQPGRFVLAVGTLEPRKNLLRLIGAHSRLDAETRRSHPLLIMGPRGWEEKEILAAAGSRGSNVRLTGYVPDGELASLYAACAVFCFPSLYEGFGLPVLEAMAAGAAVVTSRVSSLPEVGGDAVVYVDPKDERSIARALEELLGSKPRRAELARRARTRAARFSWRATAEAIRRELEGAAAGRHTTSA
jgi:glycosyltransferase involved in cell wall biosynthesis